MKDGIKSDRMIKEEAEKMRSDKFCDLMTLMR